MKISMKRSAYNSSTLHFTLLTHTSPLALTEQFVFREGFSELFRQDYVAVFMFVIIVLL